MKVLKFKTTEDTRRVFFCLVILFSFVFSSGCQQRVKVVVNKPQTEIEVEKFTGIAEKLDTAGCLVSRTTYKDGVRHGEYWTYFSNGNIRYNGFRLDGELDGEIKEFDREGNLFSIAIYEVGVCKQEVFYSDSMPFMMRDIQKKIEYEYNEKGEVVSEWYYGKDR